MRKNLRVIIPVAGIGSRLRPHTHTVPKPLIPVAGKPVLGHVIDPILELEPEEFTFVIGHMGDQIADYVRDKYNVKSSFVEQTDLLGLGYAVYLALRDSDNTPVLIALGDTIARTNFSEFISGGGNIIALSEVENPDRFGVALVEGDKITAFEEKQENAISNLALIGLYYFEEPEMLKKQLEKLIRSGKKTSGEIQLTDALEFMIRDGVKFRPFLVNGWYDCGERVSMLETNRSLLSESSEVADYPGSVIIPPVYISPSAIIEESVIGPFVSISDNAKIHRSVIRDSIICDGAAVEFCLLDSSLIGEQAVVRGTYCRLNVGDSSEFGYI